MSDILLAGQQNEILIPTGSTQPAGYIVFSTNSGEWASGVGTLTPRNRSFNGAAQWIADILLDPGECNQGSLVVYAVDASANVIGLCEFQCGDVDIQNGVIQSVELPTVPSIDGTINDGNIAGDTGRIHTVNSLPGQTADTVRLNVFEGVGSDLMATPGNLIVLKQPTKAHTRTIKSVSAPDANHVVTVQVTRPFPSVPGTDYTFDCTLPADNPIS